MNAQTDRQMIQNKLKIISKREKSRLDSHKKFSQILDRKYKAIGIRI